MTGKGEDGSEPRIMLLSVPSHMGKWHGINIAAGGTKKTLDEALQPFSQTVDQVLTIQCPHGSTVIYRTLDDIPSISVKSPCGVQDCWAIYYESEMAMFHD